MGIVLAALLTFDTELKSKQGIHSLHRKSTEYKDTLMKTILLSDSSLQCYFCNWLSSVYN